MWRVTYKLSVQGLEFAHWPIRVRVSFIDMTLQQESWAQAMAQQPKKRLIYNIYTWHYNAYADPPITSCVTLVIIYYCHTNMSLQGAIREIRRDVAFLAKEKLSERLQLWVVYIIPKQVCVQFSIHCFVPHAEIMSEQPRQRRYSTICKWANMKWRRREESQEDEHCVDR